MYRTKLNTLWTQGRCTGNVSYISNNEICVASGNYIKICDTEGKERSFLGPAHGISYLTASDILGVVAMSDCTVKPTIHIARYPEFNFLPTRLCNGAKYEYLRISFVGADCLISVEGGPDFSIVLWRWTVGYKLCTVEQTLVVREPSSFRFSTNPSKWFSLCFQQSKGMMFLTIEDLFVKADVTKRILYLPQVEDETCASSLTDKDVKALTCFEEIGKRFWGIHSESVHMLPVPAITNLPKSEVVELYDSLVNRKRVIPTCHCWLSPNDIVVGCVNGAILKIHIRDLSVNLMYRIQEDSLHRLIKEFDVITCVAMYNGTLHVSKRNGSVWKFNTSENNWQVLEVVQMKVSIWDLLFSPDYKLMTIVSLDGSIFISNPRKDKYVYCLMESNPAIDPVVGVCTPYASHYMTAKKSGLIEIWDIDYGVLVSTFHLSETIACLEGSPLCSTALIGSTNGYVYLIDATNVNNLRIVHAIRPYDVPVSHIRYENFGRYFVLASGKQNIFVMNGVPSSGFPLLGLKKMSYEVIDIAIFTKEISGETLIILLVMSSNSHVENSGDLLIKLALPNDFYKTYKNYWKNDAGFLTESMSIHIANMQYPGVALTIHCVYGALVFTPKIRAIQVILIGSEYIPEIWKPETWIATVHESDRCVLRLDPTHNWLASVNEDGKVCIYSIREPMCQFVTLSSHGYQNQGVNCVCFSEVKPILITGGEDGIIVSHTWAPPRYQDLPTQTPWLAHCWMLKSKQNAFVSSMKKHDPTNMKSWENESSEVENQATIESFLKTKVKLEEEMNALYKHMSVIVAENYSLPLEHQLDSGELILDLSVTKKLLERRTRLLLLLRYKLRTQLSTMRNEAAKIKHECIDNMIVRGQTVKSLRTGKMLRNYSLSETLAGDELELERVHKKRRMQIDKISSRVKYSHYERRSKTQRTKHEHELDTSTVDDPFMYDSLDLKSREQKVDQITMLKDTIRRRKLDFNQKFDNLVTLKKAQKNVFQIKIARLKFIISVLKIKETIWEPNWWSGEIGEGFFDDLELEITASYEIIKNGIKSPSEIEHIKSQSEYYGKEKKNGDSNEVIFRPSAEEEDTLNELVKPDFMEDVIPVEWSRSEQELAKEFSAQTETRKKRRQRYLEDLQEEFNELKDFIKHLIQHFDSSHQNLVTEKLKCDFIVSQNEFKIAILLFTVAVDDQLKIRENYDQREIEIMRGEETSFDMDITEAKNVVSISTKVLEDLTNRGKQISDMAKMVCQDKRVAKLLFEAFHKRPETIKNIFKEPPHAPSEVIYTKHKIFQLLQELNSDINRPGKADVGSWKRMCYLRMQKFTTEEKIKHQLQKIEYCKSTVQARKARKQELQKDIWRLEKSLEFIHRQRVLCTNDSPQVLTVAYRNLEMYYPDDLSSTAMVMRRGTAEDWSRWASETVSQYLTAVKNGSYVRNRLTRDFVQFKRLYLKVQEGRKKVRAVDGVSVSRELKNVIASGIVTPHAKEEALQRTVKHEERELRKQATISEAEANKLERDVATEVKRHKYLEDRIQTLQNKYAQLTRLRGSRQDV